jgi:hypothetical protein
MSAPAALAMAKLFYPETKTSKHRAEDVYNMEKGYFLFKDFLRQAGVCRVLRFCTSTNQCFGESARF